LVDTDDDGSSSTIPLSSFNLNSFDGWNKAKNKRAKGVENSGYKESLYNMMEVRKYIASQRI
jgi:hypothetical protein